MIQMSNSKIVSINDLNVICENSENYNSDNYVGIRYNDDGIKVFFPLGYDIPSDINEFRISVVELIKTINVSNSLNSGIEKSMSSGNDDEIPINSFIWVINDYLKNGLFYDNEKTFVKGLSGKINWKKTINSDYLVSNGNIIYLNPIVEKNEINDSIITDIQAFCINRSIDYIGWIYGNIKKLNTNINDKYISYYTNILNKELLHAFNDRKKQLLINLKRILEECGGDSKIKLRDFGTYDYYVMWEKMVNDLFGNQPANLFFPSANWHIINESKPFKDSNLRPDTILTVGKEDIYILDSKYYKYGITKNNYDLPHTDSIQKQITYGEHIDESDMFNYSNIYNAFVLPYNKRDNPFDLHNDIEYYGFAESNWKNNNKLYEHIALIFIDTKYLIKNYLNNRDEDVFELISSIQKVIDSFNN